MGFFRKTILIVGAIWLMPSPPPVEGEVVQPSLSATSYVAAAALALNDVKGFCERQPAACMIGLDIAAKVEAKIKYSAKLAYEWANESDVPAQAEPDPKKLALADPQTTGSVPAAQDNSSFPLESFILAEEQVGPSFERYGR